MQPAFSNFRKTAERMLRTAGGPYAALVLLLIVCCVSNESFRSIQNLINIMRQVSYSGIIALGMTFVIAAGGIDLSVGSLLALSGVLSILGMNALPVSPEWAVVIAGVIAAAVGAAGGTANGLLVSVGKIPPFIATLGTMVIFRSLALYFADSGLVSTENEVFRTVGDASFVNLPLPVWVLLLLTLLLSVLLFMTRFGRHVCAVGSNERVARYSGIRTGLVKYGTYLIAGLASGVAAFLFGGRLNAVSSTGAGISYELDAIAAVIIGGSSMNGGRATVWGTLAGVLILGIVSNVLDMWGISVTLQGTVKGIVIIVAVMIQRKRG